MSLAKVNILVVGIYLMFLLMGVSNNFSVYKMLREDIYFKDRIVNSVKYTSKNAQDDFRKSSYGILEAYVNKNLEESIAVGKRSDLENERKEILAVLKQKIENDRVLVRKMSSKVNDNGFRIEHFMRGKNVERRYYFGYEGSYHKKHTCVKYRGGRREIFSSMDEAAKNGLYPCEDCVLKNLG